MFVICLKLHVRLSHCTTQLITNGSKAGSVCLLSGNKAAACCHCATASKENVTVSKATSAQYTFWGKVRDVSIPHPFSCDLQAGTGVGNRNFQLPARLRWKLKNWGWVWGEHEKAEWGLTKIRKRLNRGTLLTIRSVRRSPLLSVL